MKKLFLAAMLVVGATSFGAVVKPVNQAQGTTDALLPLVVTGNVIEPTDLMLEVTPVLNAGPDGKSLALDFGDLIKGKSKQTLNGVKIDYSLAQPKGEAGVKTNRGTVVVSADATDVGVTTGLFTDTGLSVKISVPNQKPAENTSDIEGAKTF